MKHLPDKDLMCPATGFARSCRNIVTECQCPKYIHIRGKDNNTGEEIDKFDCVDGFLPMLLIENSNMQRQTAAAVESFRNEMVKANEASLRLLLQTSQQAEYVEPNARNLINRG